MLTSICLFKPSRSSNWYVQYKDTNGIRRQKSTRCSNKHDALKALTEIKTLIKSKPRVILFSKLAEQFLTYARSNYPCKTYAIYKATLQRFQSICGDVELNKLSAQHWDTYRVERLKQTVHKKFTNRISPVSVNIELRTLRAFLNTLIRWGHLERNPFSKQPFASVSEQAPVFFTKEDFQKLLGFIKQPWLKEAVIFSVVTGLRRGELIHLRWQDVDLQRRIITIQSSPSFRTKQGKMRILPLCNTAYQLLASKQTKSTGEYVFMVYGKQLARHWLSQAFKYAVREAKLNDKLHWHSLRSSFASWLVMDGVSIYSVSKLLGHSSVTITQKHYAHLETENLHSEVNKISISMN